MSSTAVPLCPICRSPAAAWEIDSPVRAHDRVAVGPSGLRSLGLVIPDGGLEPLDRPVIRCTACGWIAAEESVRESVLVAASAATRGERPRFDA